MNMSASLDAGAALAIAAAFVGWLPPIAAILAILWYLLQFWESRTLQTFMQRRARRKIVRLTARLAALQLHAAAGEAATELKAVAKQAAADLKKVDAPIPPYEHEK